GLLLVTTLVAHEHACMSHHAVPRLANRIVEGHQTSLILWKVADGSERQPFDRSLTRSEEIANEGDARRGRGYGTQPVSQPGQERARSYRGSTGGPRGRLIGNSGHGYSPFVRLTLSSLAAAPRLQDANSATRSSTCAEVSGRKSAGRSVVPS